MEGYAYTSGLRHVNASLKTAFSLAVLLEGLLLDSPWVSVFIIVTMLCLTVCAGGVRPADYMRMLGIPAAFIVFGGIALLFTTGDPVKTAEVSLRALGAISAFYFLILSTPVSEILMTFRKCHCPRLIVELMYLIYRFIFVLTDVWNCMNTAARSRLGYVDYKTSLRTFGKIAGNLFVLSMKRADACYDAMESRCYTGDICFLEETKKCRIGERIFVLLYLCGLAAVRRFFG